MQEEIRGVWAGEENASRQFSPTALQRQTGYEFMDFAPFHQMVKVRKLKFQGFMSYISDHLGWFGIICNKSGAF